VIGSVRGTVLERSPSGEVIVEVGGVGYRLLVPLNTLASLAPGEPAFLFTHLHARDDGMVLYGFASRDERDTFESLIGVTGVGPKLAVAILSVHAPTALRRALVEADLDALMLVPNVGKRTAQRLMVDLQARLEVPATVGGDGLDPGATTARAEVRDALAGLGYSPEEVRQALARVPDEGRVEDMLRDALKVLATARA